MKAEQILSVLMDDKKYKARVEELKALEAKLSVVQKIASTVEEAQALVVKAADERRELENRRAEVEQYLKCREQELKDAALAERVDMARKLTEDRKEFLGVREMAKQAKVDKEMAEQALREAQTIMKQAEKEMASARCLRAQVEAKIAKLNQVMAE